VLSLGADLDRGYALVTPSAIVVDPVDGRRVSTYRFRHAAIQQYLLAHLDLVELPHMHAAVGKALEEVHAGHVPDVATKLAFHFEQGGVVAKAVGYLLLAAEHATALAAQQDGLSHLRHAESLLERLPEAPQRDVLELGVRMARIVTLSQTRQEEPTEVLREIRRVKEIAARAPDDPRVCKALLWLALLQGLQGQYATAVRTAGDCRAGAERLGAGYVAAAARSLAGVFRLRTGDLTGAREELDTTAPSATTRAGDGFSIAGMHPEVWRLTGLGYLLFFLGYPDQGLARMQDAVAVANRDGAPASRVYAMGLKASLHAHRREPDAAEDLIHATLQLLRGRVYSRSDVLSGFVLGWALVQRGETFRGIDLIAEAVRQVRDGTLKVDWTKFLARFGEAQCRAGRATDALRTLDEGLAAAASTGERYYEAELLRLRGEALEAMGEPTAEEWYLKAVEVARAQSARAWELRASTNLARAWIKAGRRSEARSLLEAVCGWFTEGRSTPDVIDAITLLNA
jgi:adenylate cyclase